MKRLLPLVFLLLSFNLNAQNAPTERTRQFGYGTPATPELITYTQPNGDKITYRLKGDAAVNWCETPDGYPIVKANDGYFKYARTLKSGKQTPTGIVAHDIQTGRTSNEIQYLLGAKKGSPYSAAQIVGKRDSYLSGGPIQVTPKAFPTSGTRNLLLLLVEFPNAAHQIPSTTFDNMFNQDDWNGTGSFKQFYYQNSYGQLTVVTVVSGWYMAPQNHDYYSYSLDPGMTRARGLVRNVVDAANAFVDYSQFDNDNDGVVDGVMVIHEGDGAETGNSANIWSHSWVLGPQAVSYDGVTINPYTINPEFYNESTNIMSGIGTPCHEFGHNLGLPDFYDTDDATNGTAETLGAWDCMDGGSYNNNQRKPAHHNCWSKNYLGWISSIPVLSTAQAVTMLNVEFNPVAYRVNTTTTNEYFLLENRQRLGFDNTSDLPGHGLVIYHVDGPYITSHMATNDINATAAHQGFDMEEAGDATHNADDPFPGTGAETSFTDATSPNSLSWAGANTAKPITSITESQNTIYFNFMGGTLFPVITNVVYTPSIVLSTNTVQVDATITDNGTISSARLEWCTDNVSFSNNITMNVVSGSNYRTASNIPAQATGTTVYFRIRATDNNGNVTVSVVYWYTVVPPTYCTSDFINMGSEWISNVTMNTINQSSGDDLDDGYTDFTAVTTNVARTVAYPLSVTVNTNGAYTDHVWAYIDWNHDYDFADAGESFDLGQVTNVTAGVVTQSITIPAAAALGSTRMRINIMYNGDPGACDSDHAEEWGETEDYTLNVLSGSCSYPTTQVSALSVPAKTGTTATLNWTRGNGGKVLIVARQGSAVNANPTDGATYTANTAYSLGAQIGTGNYVVYNGTGSSVTITGLTCNTYYFALYEYNTTGNCYLLPSLTGNTTITVPDQPAAISGLASPCQWQYGAIYSTTEVSGVTYTWTVPSGWTIQTGQGTDSISVDITTTSGNITATPSNECGSGTAATLAITTLASPSQPSSVTGLSTPCQGSSQTYSVTNVAGVTYSWSFPAGWTITSGTGTNSVIVTVGAASGSISVSAVNSCGNSMPRLKGVAPSLLPAQPSAITGNASPCEGATGLTYSVTNSSGVTYTWTVPSGWTITSGQGTNTITATATSSSGNITVTPSNACGSGTAQTLAITTIGLPGAVSAITGSTTPCNGQTGIIYSVTNVAGITYTWSVPSGWTITAGQGTNIITTTIGANSGNVSVTPSTACGSGTAQTLAVTTQSTPAQPVAAAGQPTPCYGATVTFSVINVAGITYTWSFPADWTIVSGQGTNSITVTVGNASGNLTVTPSNICGNGTALVVPIAPTYVPAQPSAIAGSNAPCSETTKVYSVTGSGTMTWSVPADWTITSGQGTNTLTVVIGTISGNVTVTPSNSCGNGPSSTLAVTVFILPTQSSVITGNTSPCQGSTGNIYSVVLVADLSYAWTVPADWTITSGQGTNIITVTAGVQSGNVTVIPTNKCGSGAVQILAVSTMIAPAQPSVITGNNNPCQDATGLTYSVTNVPGVTYTWTVPAGWSITSGQGNNSITVTSSAAAGTITVVPSNACGNGTSRTLAVTFIPVPAQPSAISGNFNPCANTSGLNYSITNVAGVTYTWTVPSGWTINSGQGTNNIVVTSGSAAGNIVVVPSNACGNGTSQSLVVSTQPVPLQPSAITGNNNPCQTITGLNYNVTNVAGVTYTWTVPAGWSITAGQGSNSITVTAGVAAGNITVTPSNGCGNGTAQTLAVTTQTVPSQPSAIAGNNSPCQSATGLNYSVTNVAGLTYTWTVPAGWSITAGQGSNSITVTASASAGTITVVPSNTCGNGTSQTLAVTTQTVPAQPSAITGNNNPCQSATGLTYSVTNVAGLTYTWTVPAGWSITAGQGSNSITVTAGAAAGTITVVPSNSCGNGTSRTLAVTIQALPSQPSAIAGNANPCQSATGLNYSITNVAGLTYTWTVPAGWSITAGQGSNSITVTAGASAGTITVVPSNTCGNGTSQTLAVTTQTVPAQPSAITGNNNPCQSATGLTYSITNVAGLTYTWTVPAGWSITAGQGSNSITVTAGAAAGTITVVPSNTCGNGTSQTLAVTTQTVPAQPSAITGNNNPCQSATGLTYSVTNVAGLTYTWTVPAGWSITAGQGSNSITVTAGASAGTITVVPSNTCGNGTSQTLAVTTQTVPAQPSAITGNNNPCQSATGLTYSITNVAGLTYTWTVPAGWSITAGQGSNSITVTAGAAAGTITVVPSNTCGNGTSQTLAVTTQTVPAQPSAITGNNNPCQSATGLTYSITNVAGLTYTWTVPAGWSITAGQGSNSITVTAGAAAGTITVVPSNTCGNGTSQTLAVTTQTVPAQPSAITGNNNPCQSATGLTYSVTNVAGLTYTWTVPAGWSITAGQGSNSITVTAGAAAGTITVVPSNTCGNGTSQTLAITTQTVPAQPSAITGNNNPCQSATGLTYSVTNIAGLTYTWTVPAGWSITAGQGSNSITVTAGASAGTITVVPSNTCGNGTSRTLAVTTQTVPAQPSAITGNNNPCQSATGLTYSITNIAGLTYTWTVPAGWSITAGQGSNSITVTAGAAAGTITVVPSNTCGNGTSQTLAVTTQTVPAQPSSITGNNNPCQSATGLTYSVTNVAGLTYTWTVPAGWSITAGQGSNSITVTAGAAAGTITVVPSNTCGNGTSQTLAITTQTVPAQPSAITGNNNPCQSATGLTYSVTNVAGLTYTWTVPAGWSITSGQGSNSITVTAGASAGTITVVPSNTCGNGTSRTLAVTTQTVPAQPSAITGNNNPCQSATGLTYSVTNVAGLTYTWTVPAGWSITAGQGSNSITVTAGAAAGTITVVPSNTCGNGTSQTLAVTALASPSITLQPIDAFAGSGGNTSFVVNATGAGLGYQWQLSTNGGGTWNNISAAGSNPTYGGYTTNTLTLNGVILANDTYQYRCIITGSCVPSVTSSAATLHINLAPVITVHPVSVTVCAGTSTSFGITATGSGLTYQWQISTDGGGSWANITTAGSNPTYSNWTTNTLTLTNVVIGNNAYQYRCIVDNGVPPAATSNAGILTVNTVPSLPSAITGNTSPCQNTTGLSYSVTNVTGVTYTWSVPAGWSITSGQGNNSIVVTAGTIAGNIVVVPSNSCGNGSSQSLAVTTQAVPAQPSAITGNNTPCQNITGLTYSVTNVAGTTYTWAVPIGWGITAGQGTNSITVTAGTAAGNILVVPSNACGNGTSQTLAVTTQTVPAQPSAITGNNNPCQSATGLNYSVTNVAGLTYTWTVPAGWSITVGQGSNSITVTAGISGGTISVVPSNACGNGSSQSLAITTQLVPPQPSVITGITSPCMNSTGVIYSVVDSVGVTYTWTVPAGSTVASGQGTHSITVNFGTTNGNITVTPSNACGNGTPRTLAVTLSAAAPARPSVIAGSITPCQGSSQVYSVTNTAGVTYNWSFPSADWILTAGAGTNSITVTVGSTSGNVRVTATNGCGTSTPRTRWATVTLLPAQPSTITGNSTPCLLATGLSYTVTNVVGVTYTWTVPTGWTITAGQNTNTITVTAGAGAVAGNITVVPSNTCGNGTSRTLAVSPITVPAQPSTITGNSTPCISTTGLIYSVTNIAGVTYTWTVPAGWTITAGQTTNSITVTSGVAGGTITVVPSNSCGNGTSRTLAVTTMTVPAQPSTISGVNNPCSGATGVSYNVTNVAGVTYTWTVPAGWSITAGQGTNNITVTAGAAAGTITVVPSNACGNGTSRTLAVTVRTVPAQPSAITGNSNPCINITGLTYNVTNVAGVTYTWTVPADWTITAGQGSNSITVTSGTLAGSIVVTPSNSCGNGTAQSLAVTTQTVPAQPSAITGNNNPCINTTGIVYNVTNIAGVTYTWTVPAGWSITAGQGSNSITVTSGVAGGTITVVPSNTCGNGTSQTLAVTTMTVPAQPSAITGNTNPCINTTGLTYNVTNIAGVTYTWTVPAGWSITAGQGSNNITVTSGNAGGNITVVPSNTCGNGTSRTLAVTTMTVPAQPSAVTGNTNPCINTTGLSYSVTNIAGVTYTWTVPAGWSITAGQGSNSITVTSGNASGNIVVVPSNTCGNGTSQTLAVTTMTVPAQPSAITGNNNPCINITGLTYSVTNVAGVTYTWTVPSGWAITAGQGSNSITVTSGTLTGNIVATPSNICGNGTAQTLAVTTMTVPAQPSAIAGNNNPCINTAGITYNVTNTAGVTYTWTVPAGWSITAGQGSNSITVTSGVAGGTITVVPSNTCGNGTSQTLAVTTMTVPAQPSAITGNTNPCINTTGLTYNVTNIAGVTYTWTVPAGWSITAGQGSNNITVTSGNAGGNITVVPSNTCGNGTSRTLAVTTMTVPAQPSAITGNTNPCINTTGLTYSVTNVAGVTYTWTVPADWSITAGQGSNSITVTAGTIAGNISITPSNICGNGTAQSLAFTTQTVPAQPSVIAGNANPCINTTGLNYIVTNVAGVTYTWTVPSGWAITAGQGSNSITVTSGTLAGNIVATPSNTCGNGTAQTLAVTTMTVPAQPSAITGNNNPCINTTGLTYSVTNVAGVTYTWTVPAGWSITAGQGNNSITVTSGNAGGTITVVPSNTCGNGTSQTLAVTTMTVPAQPSAIAGNTNPCINTTGLTYNVTNTAGVTYTWTVPAGWSITAGQGSNNITVTSGNAGGNITVVPSNTCGNGTSQTLAVSTMTVPVQPSAITGNTNPCINTTGLTYSVTNVAGVTYTWTVPADWSITAGQGSNSITVTAGTMAGNISITPSNICGNGTAQSLAVTTQTVPAQPSVIAGNANPCINTTGLNYIVTNVAGVTYTWTVPADWAITAGQGSNSITVTSGTLAGNIVATPSNTCGDGTAQTLAVTTMTIPAQPSSIAGNTNPCINTTGLTYNVTNVAGVTYSWTVPADWTITAGQGSNSITVTSGTLAGNVVVIPSNVCGNGTVQTLAVTTMTVPAQPSAITGNNNPCVNTTGLSYSVINTAGVTYTWTVPADWMITAGQGSNNITVTSGTVAGNIVATPSNICGNGIAQTLAVTTQTVPAQPSVIAGNNNPCINTAGFVYTISDVAGITYTWTVPADWTITAGQGSNSIMVTTGINAGSISVTPSNLCGDGVAQTLAVAPMTVPAQPSAIIGNTSPCINTSGHIYSITNIAGETYNWTVPADWTITSGQGSNSITVTAGTLAGSITVEPSNVCGIGTIQTLAVNTMTVPAQPSAIIGPITPCQGSIGLTYTVTNIAGLGYVWTVPADWTITSGQGSNSIVVNSGLLGGDVSVAAFNMCGMGTAQALTITLNSIPAQPTAIGGNLTPCINTASLVYAVTFVPGETYSWTVPADWTITAGQGTDNITVTSGIMAGNISVTPSNVCGSGTMLTVPVTPMTVPAQPSTITGNTIPCINSIGYSYSVTNVAGVTYSWSVPADWSITAGQGSNSITVTSGTSAGSITVVPSNICGSGLAQTLGVSTMTVPAQPSAISGNITPCQGETGVLYNVTNVPGTTYTWSVPADWSISAGQGSSSITVTAGTMAGNISVTPSNVCGSGTSELLAVSTMTIPAQPSVITGNTYPCFNTALINYSVSDVAGVTYTWTVPSDWTITSGQGTNAIAVTSGSLAGNISVVPSNVCGNGIAQTLAVSTQPAPAQPVSITGTTNPCINTSGLIYEVPDIIGETYTWSVPTDWTITAGQGSYSIVVTSGSGAGTISAVPSNICGSGIAQSLAVTTMTVPSQPSAITGNNSPCINTTGLTYSVINIPGLTYTWMVPADWSITAGQGSNIITVTSGTMTGGIFVTPSNACGNGIFQSLAVSTQTVPATAAAILGSINPCQNTNNLVYSTSNTVGVTYTWSVPADWNITAGQGTNSIVADAGLLSGNVVVTPSNLCGNGAPQTLNVTLNTVPTQPSAILGNASPCTNSTALIYSVTNVAGVSYNWTVPADWSITAGQGSNSITVDAGSATGTITVTPSNVCGDGTLQSIAVTTTTVPAQPSAIIGNTLPCPGTIGLIYSVTNIAGVTYTWSVPADWTITAGQGSNSITVTAGTSAGNIFVIPVNTCGNGTLQSLPVATQTVPAIPSAITGNDAPCSGSTGISYTVTNIAGVTYTWTVPADWSITAGQGTSSITVTAGLMSGNIIVTPSNTCGNGIAQNLAVTTTDVPAQPSAISGMTNPCFNTSGLNYSVAAVAGTTYTWSVPADWTITAGQGTSSLTVTAGAIPGNISVTPSNSCGAGMAQSLVITMKMAPNQPDPIAGTSNPCQGTTGLNYTVTNEAGVMYMWSTPADWSITAGQGTNSLTVTAGTMGGSIIVMPVNACGMGSMQVMNVQTQFIPVQPSLIAGTTNPCVSSTGLTYSVGNVAGVTYNWTVPADWTITSGQGSNSITATAGSSAGSITVEPSNTCGIGTTQTLVVSPLAVPSQPTAITGTTLACSGTTGLNYQVSNVSGVSYLWTVPADWTITSGQGSNSITVTAGTIDGNIITTPSNGCGAGLTQSLAVSSQTTPSQASAISGAVTSCQGSTGLTYSVTDVPGLSYNWSVPSDWVIVSGQGSSAITVNAGNSAGNITVIPSNACGNGPAQSLAVSIQMMVTASVSIDQLPTGGFCEGSIITFTANAVNGGSTPVYEWFHNGVSVGSGPSYTAVSIADGDEIYVNLTSSVGCVTPAVASSAITVVTVYPTPAAPVITMSFDTLISSYPSGNQWYTTSNILTGETNQTYIPLVNDTYYVMYTDINGCSSTSDTVQILNASIDETAITFSMYPNPVIDELHIDFGEPITEALLVQVYNAIGELLQEQTYTQLRTVAVRMGSYPDGVYFITLYYQGKKVVQKIVLNRN